MRKIQTGYVAQNVNNGGTWTVQALWILNLLVSKTAITNALTVS